MPSNVGYGEKVADLAFKALAGGGLDLSSPAPLNHQAAQAIEDGRLPRGSELKGDLAAGTMTRTAFDTDERPFEYGSHSCPTETYCLETMPAGP